MTTSQKYPASFNFDAAIDECVSIAQETGYKDLNVLTNQGSIVGEFVQKTEQVLILREDTGITHSKTGKEKVALSFIKLDTIIAISVYTLD